ncbi:MAG TPA: hypothetical protein PLE32_01660, partial [Haliscomenobacter sp.]|nr:hypothetical protein [Haliscomenobacter sp.]
KGPRKIEHWPFPLDASFAQSNGKCQSHRETYAEKLNLSLNTKDELQSTPVFNAVTLPIT